MQNFPKTIQKPIVSLLLTLVLLVGLLAPLAPSAGAAALLPESIAIAQTQRGTCTLASAAMMIRARMYLSGSASWELVTEQSVRGDVWMEGVGVYYSWTYTGDGVTVSGEHEELGGISEAGLQKLLAQHPEGIELYCGGVPHAVLVTDYTDGVFYCFDPAESYSGKRIALADSWLGAKLGSQSSILASATAYWYLSEYQVRDDGVAPSAEPTPAPSNEPNPVRITAQPSDQGGAAGEKVTFSVEASGTGKLSYQWEYSRDGQSWQRSSATGKTVTCRINDTTVGSYYRCVVSDQYGQSVRSHAAQIVIAQPPVITRQPSDQTAAMDERVTFRVEAEGENLTYQWQYSNDGGTTWKDSSSTSQSVSAVVTTARAGRLYRCVVSNAYGLQTISASAAIRATKALVITQQPTDFTGALGQTAKFAVTAEGDDLSYQWQYSDDDGQTWSDGKSKQASMSIKLTEARDGRLYRCAVTDSHSNRVISRAVRMQRQDPVTITRQPTDFTGASGETGSFSVAAEGKGLSYQWQYSDDGGATWTASKSTQDIASVTVSAAHNGRLYCCVITDQNGNSAVSDSAKLSLAKVKITAQPKNVKAAKHSIARFGVGATGEGLRYQWQISTDGKKWANAAQTEQLTWIATGAANGRMVRCIVTDAYGNQAVSNAVKLTVS